MIRLGIHTGRDSQWLRTPAIHAIEVARDCQGRRVQAEFVRWSASTKESRSSGGVDLTSDSRGRSVVVGGKSQSLSRWSREGR